MSNEQELLEHYTQLYYFVTDPDNDNESMEDEVTAAEEEIMAFVNASQSPHEAIYLEIVRLFSHNVFRPLPPPSKSRRRDRSLSPSSKSRRADRSLSPSSKSRRAESGSYEEDSSISPPYLHYVFFSRLLKTPALKFYIMQNYVNDIFVMQLLKLFNTEDETERQLLSTLILKIYAKFFSLRAYIQKSINNIFYSFMYENEHHNGISDLLFILVIVIRSFSLPLDEEHNIFFRKVLMPLHKMDSLSDYHVELASCVLQFVRKDPTLSSPIVDYLLKTWPKTDGFKSAMFLNEIAEILAITQPAEFQKVMKPLIQKIAMCVSSPHFTEAECALSYWTDDYFIELINDHSNDLLPIMFPSFEKSKNHWSKNVRDLTYHVLDVCRKMNPLLYDEYMVQTFRLDRLLKRPKPQKKSKALKNKNLKFKEKAPLNANDMPESTIADLPKAIVKCPPEKKLKSRQTRLPVRFRL